MKRARFDVRYNSALLYRIPDCDTFDGTIRTARIRRCPSETTTWRRRRPTMIAPRKKREETLCYTKRNEKERKNGNWINFLRQKERERERDKEGFLSVRTP